MNAKLLFAAGIVLAVVAGALFGGWYVLRRQPPAFCQISGRPIHANMVTYAQVDGKKVYACCARCVLTLARQTGKTARILEVTDYATGRRLAARDAYFVDGSDVHMCAGPRLEVDESRTPYYRFFDRCEPSLLAFASEQRAREFAAEHGGTVRQVEELEREVRPAASATEKVK
jgi:hypothetical protein